MLKSVTIKKMDSLNCNLKEETVYIKKTDAVNFCIKEESVLIKKNDVSIIVYAQEVIAMVKFTPFDFTATSNQTIFDLGVSPLTLVGVYINGISQRTSDYILDDTFLILDEPCDVGDKVFGIFQEVA